MWTVIIVLGVMLILSLTDILPRYMTYRERMAELKNKSKEID
jgi:hypothetical protein